MFSIYLKYHSGDMMRNGNSIIVRIAVNHETVFSSVTSKIDDLPSL